MEFGEKLKEMNMTTDEITRFTNAFKDPKFKELLQEYAQEISDPKTKMIYEQEIKKLELERGMEVNFIHPKPFRVLKTSVDGKQKCFVNICSNESVGKPEFKAGRSNDGTPGQHWSLPHSLTPGRNDIDTKGKKVIIYDVVFHPVTLHFAGTNKKLMDMVDGVAVQAIQDRFEVKLDKNNTRVLKIKYKGTPVASVTRKTIPGHPGQEKPAQPDLLSFPYPDKRPNTEAPNPKKDLNTEVQSSQNHHKSDSNPSKGSTKPNYTVKYVEHIDLQDFRLSRDSARSPRPKEIVITVELPLLRSVGELDLDVTENTVLLHSKKPAYSLELALAYPVDYDKGEAKFNKLTHQLTVTLPVLPLKQPTNLPCLSEACNENEEGEDNDMAVFSKKDKSTVPGQGEEWDQEDASTANSSEGTSDYGSDPAPSDQAGKQPGLPQRDRQETGLPGGFDQSQNLRHCEEVGDRAGDRAGDPTGDQAVDQAVDWAGDRAGDQAVDQAVDRAGDQAGDLAGDRAGDQVDKAGNNAEDQTGDQAENQAGDQAVDQTENTGYQAGDQAEDQAADQAEDQAVDQADNAGDQSGDQAVDQADNAGDQAEEQAEDQAEDQAENQAGDQTDKAGAQAEEQAGDLAVGQTGDQAVDQTENQAGDQIGHQAADCNSPTREEEEQAGYTHLNKSDSEPLCLISNMVFETNKKFALSTFASQPDLQQDRHQTTDQLLNRDTREGVTLPEEDSGSPTLNRSGIETERLASFTGTEVKPAPPRGQVNNSTVHVCEDMAGIPQKTLKEEEGVDEDDLPLQQTFPHDCNTKQFVPPAVLWETKEDGQEVAITEHATSAGFSFKNTLLYDLD